MTWEFGRLITVSLIDKTCNKVHLVNKYHKISIFGDRVFRQQQPEILKSRLHNTSTVYILSLMRARTCFQTIIDIRIMYVYNSMNL